VVAIWAILILHVYLGLFVVTPILKPYTGTVLGLTWGSIGLIIFYNVMFNHILAVIVKPGSPTDLVRIEKMIKENKHQMD